MKLLVTFFLAGIATAFIFALITLTGIFIGIISMMMPFIIIFVICAIVIHHYMDKIING